MSAYQAERSPPSVRIRDIVTKGSGCCLIYNKVRFGCFRSVVLMCSCLTMKRLLSAHSSSIRFVAEVGKMMVNVPSSHKSSLHLEIRIE